MALLPYAVCAAPAPTQSAARITTDTSMDFLSSDAWRALPREERQKVYQAAYVARFEPDGQPTLAKLDTYIARYKQINIYDPRLFVYNVKAKHVAGTTGSIALSGEVSVARYKTGTQSTLQRLGFNVVQNDINVLPDSNLGKEIYAISTTPTATLRKEPRSNAEQVNSIPMGGWARLLREARPDDIVAPNAPTHRSPKASETANKWYLAQSSEGYLGFMPAEDFIRSQSIPRLDAVLLQPCPVSGGTENAPRQLLPMATFLTRNGESKTAKGGSEDSDSASFSIPGRSDLGTLNHCLVAELGPAFTEDEVLSLSEPLLKTRYVWGGVNESGIDCSGFTQFLYKTHGIFLPRDAEEQATMGRIVGFGADAEKLAQPGDLFFFMNDQGKINHVGVSLGNGRIIHSSGPGVHVTTLAEEDEFHASSLRQRLMFARRIQGR